MYTVKKISKLTRMPKATLRYYDKEQIVCPKRHENGYRLYNDTDILQLKYLSLLKYAKFPLPEIKILITATNSEFTKECNERCVGIISSGISRLQKTIESYQKIIELVKAGLKIAESSYSESDKPKIVDFIENLYDDIIIKGE